MQEGNRFLVQVDHEGVGYVLDVPQDGSLKGTPLRDELMALAEGDSICLTRTAITDAELEALSEFTGF